MREQVRARREDLVGRRARVFHQEDGAWYHGQVVEVYESGNVRMCMDEQMGYMTRHWYMTWGPREVQVV